MKILMTTDTVGGVWVYALELARALEAHGVEIVLATMGARLTALQRRELQLCRNVELAESTFRLEWMDSPWDDVDRAGEWLADLERAHRPDVVPPRRIGPARDCRACVHRARTARGERGPVDRHAIGVTGHPRLDPVYRSACRDSTRYSSSQCSSRCRSPGRMRSR